MNVGERVAPVVAALSVILLSCAIAVAGCVKRPDVQSPGGAAGIATSTQQLVFLTRDGCVNTGVMRTNVDAALRSLGLPSDYQVIDLATLRETDPRSGYPTPTLLYANRDLFGMPEPPVPHPPAT